MSFTYYVTAFPGLVGAVMMLSLEIIPHLKRVATLPCELLSTHADRQGVDISVTVCNFVCLFVWLVMDFSAEDKASGVKFCTVVLRAGQGISHFGKLYSPRSPKSENSASA